MDTSPINTERKKILGFEERARLRNKKKKSLSTVYPKSSTKCKQGPGPYCWLAASLLALERNDPKYFDKVVSPMQTLTTEGKQEFNGYFVRLMTPRTSIQKWAKKYNIKNLKPRPQICFIFEDKMLTKTGTSRSFECQGMMSDKNNVIDIEKCFRYSLQPQAIQNAVAILLARGTDLKPVQALAGRNIGDSNEAFLTVVPTLKDDDIKLKSLGKDPKNWKDANTIINDEDKIVVVTLHGIKNKNGNAWKHVVVPSKSELELDETKKITKLTITVRDPHSPLVDSTVSLEWSPSTQKLTMVYSEKKDEVRFSPQWKEDAAAIKYFDKSFLEQVPKTNWDTVKAIWPKTEGSPYYCLAENKPAGRSTINETKNVEISEGERFRKILKAAREEAAREEAAREEAAREEAAREEAAREEAAREEARLEILERAVETKHVAVRGTKKRVRKTVEGGKYKKSRKRSPKKRGTSRKKIKCGMRSPSAKRKRLYGRGNILRLMSPPLAAIELEFINSVGAGNITDLRSLVVLLLTAGADVNAKNDYGWTALMMAVFHDHVENAKLLLEAGADVNAKNNRGLTALMMAAQYFHDHVENAELLLEAGADVNVKNNRGQTALMIANNNDNERMTDLFDRYEKYMTHLYYKPGGDGYLAALARYSAEAKQAI